MERSMGIFFVLDYPYGRHRHCMTNLIILSGAFGEFVTAFKSYLDC